MNSHADMKTGRRDNEAIRAVALAENGDEDVSTGLFQELTLV